MERHDRRCFVYADIESVRDTLEAERRDVADFTSRLIALARTQGRVLATKVYGDVDHETARVLKSAGADVTVTSEDGDGSAPESIAIALDAAQSLALVPHVDATLLVTDDSQLSELVRRLRHQGRFVTVVAPQALLDAEPAKSADRALSVEELLSGDAALPVQGVTPSARTSRPTRPAPVELDLDTYDWTRLVLLLRDLEAKMPFVGMRWLKNKVIGPHNVGVHSMGDKQNLLNRAVEDGLVETYRVDNREEGGDPVTACRLVREQARVRDILDANAPSVDSAVEAS